MASTFTLPSSSRSWDHVEVNLNVFRR